MPPKSAIEWIAGANAPRRRARRRIVAEYETDDEDDEVEFFVKTKNKKKSQNSESVEKNVGKSTEPKQKPEEKAKKETLPLKSALKQQAPAAAAVSETSESAQSSDKEVETSGSEQGGGPSPEEHVKEFDPECPCKNCVRTHRALRRSRLRKGRRRVSFSEDGDSDDSDDAETVHNFFKWSQAMEAKKVRDQDAKDYTEYLAEKARKADDAKKAEAAKMAEDAKKEAENKNNNENNDKKKDEEKSNDDTTPEKSKSKKGKGNGNGKDKDAKSDASSAETIETSDSETVTSKDGTDAESSGNESSQRESKDKDKLKSKAKSKGSSPSSQSEPDKGVDALVLELLMKKLLKPKKKDKSIKEKRDKSKEKKAEAAPENRKVHNAAFSHPATAYDPNWLMPPQSNVVHVEHSIEAPSDPRPNAFFDNRHGVMRVYHGSSYGNPAGSLYQSQSNLPSKPIYSPNQKPQIYGTNGTHSANSSVQHYPSVQSPYQGYPPPHSSEMSQQAQNANQWYQGQGTTTVPGPRESPSIQHSRAAPDFTYNPKIFDEAERQYGSPMAQPQSTRPSQEAANPQIFRTTAYTNNPYSAYSNNPYSVYYNSGSSSAAKSGLDPDYFKWQNQGNGSSQQTWGVQDAHVASTAPPDNSAGNANKQSTSFSPLIKPSNGDFAAQMARERAELNARRQRSNNLGPLVQTYTQPQQDVNANGQGNNTTSNQAKDWSNNTTGNAPTNDSWAAPVLSNPQSSPVNNWDSTPSNNNVNTGPTWSNNNNNSNNNDWGNNDNGNNTQKTDDWGAAPADTSSSWNDNSNNTNNGISNTQQADNWSTDNRANGGNGARANTSPDNGPGGWPGSPNNGGSFNGSAGGQQSGQGWQDASVAQSTGGFWDSGEPDAQKAPAPTTQW